MTKSAIGGRIVALAGSPSPVSTTGRVLERILSDLNMSFETELIQLVDIPADDLFAPEIPSGGRMDKALAAIEAADAIIVGTPIYKASLSGMLKSFIDRMPQYGLAGKVVLPVGTGGSLAHALALDYALRPILQSMGARQIIQAVFLGPEDLADSATGLAGLRDRNPRYAEALLHLGEAIRTRPELLDLGHPVPQRISPRGESLGR
ncbi:MULTISPECIES: NAD(P)H-dependent oxidoreductase [Roseovarius]|uniref:FMN reductase (NADPH) n=1 Tax=Roseovarius nubinhibens TaxID=314263 RepID=A0A348WFL1_9RHOB|nr:FMN reductase (NADPH) [Roseovarius nubinhibens]|tara:strand:- start:3707 stop:4324 length:618 start_codon:yes stop_codon:yes gene_type:complete